jgi:hypothetical protein
MPDPRVRPICARGYRRNLDRAIPTTATDTTESGQADEFPSLEPSTSLTSRRMCRRSDGLM